MELILSTHSHSVDGTPLWTTIDFLSLTIKSLDNCLRCWLAAKHFLHNAKYLAMGFPHYPSWYLKSTYVCKIEKATKYLSLVTIKIFFECIFKFLKKNSIPIWPAKHPSLTQTRLVSDTLPLGRPKTKLKPATHSIESFVIAKYMLNIYILLFVI